MSEVNTAPAARLRLRLSAKFSSITCPGGEPQPESPTTGAVGLTYKIG